MIINGLMVRGFVGDIIRRIDRDLPSEIVGLCEESFDRNIPGESKLTYDFGDGAHGSHTLIMSDLEALANECKFIIGRYEPDDLHGYRVTVEDISYVVGLNRGACLEISLQARLAKDWQDEDTD